MRSHLEGGNGTLVTGLMINDWVDDQDIALTRVYSFYRSYEFGSSCQRIIFTSYCHIGIGI